MDEEVSAREESLLQAVDEAGQEGVPPDSMRKLKRMTSFEFKGAPAQASHMVRRKQGSVSVRARPQNFFPTRDRLIDGAILATRDRLVDGEILATRDRLVDGAILATGGEQNSIPEFISGVLKCGRGGAQGEYVFGVDGWRVTWGSEAAKLLGRLKAVLARFIEVGLFGATRNAFCDRRMKHRLCGRVCSGEATFPDF